VQVVIREKIPSIVRRAADSAKIATKLIYVFLLAANNRAHMLNVIMALRATVRAKAVVLMGMVVPVDSPCWTIPISRYDRTEFPGTSKTYDMRIKQPMLT
jgi:hypothetical protein